MLPEIIESEKGSTIEWVDIDSIKPNPKNRNIHSDEQIERLAKLIKNFGWRHPILISRQSGLIVAGHGRYLAAKKMGAKTVPIHIQDFASSDEEYAFGIADNASALWAELDLAGINLDLPDLGPDFDIDLLGIKDFVLEPADKYGDKDADEVPESRGTDIRLGDIFKLGNHKLICGDATDKTTVERLMSYYKCDCGEIHE